MVMGIDPGLFFLILTQKTYTISYMSQKTKLIIISGPSGSGKSTLLEHLQAQLNHPVAIIHQDNYFHNQDHLDFETRLKQNYDHPSAIDIPTLVSDIQSLKKGSSIHSPVYDFTQHTRSHKTTLIEPSPIIILDGLLSLAIPSIRNMGDFNTFIDTPIDICLVRKVLRDALTRGRTIEQLMHQYMETVRPMYFKYALPSKQHAHMVFQDGGHNTEALAVLKRYIVPCLEETVIDYA